MDSNTTGIWKYNDTRTKENREIAVKDRMKLYDELKKYDLIQLKINILDYSRPGIKKGETDSFYALGIQWKEGLTRDQVNDIMSKLDIGISTPICDIKRG